MRKSLGGAFLVAVLVSSLSFADTKIDPRLAAFAKGETKYKSAKIIAVMQIVAGRVPAPSRYNRYEVMKYLHKQAELSWQNLNSYLTQSNSNQKLVRDLHFHWINNSVSARVTVEGLKLLAQASFIKKIYVNGSVEFDQPFNGSMARRNIKDMPYDFAETALDRLIREAPEVTGKGVILGSVDTGVDGKHPALAGKIASFYDGRTRKVGDPVDYGSHGTHTVGTMIAGNRKDALIGMAPEAKVVAAGALEDYDTILHGMEFMLDPDSNPNTSDQPRAVNNSWNCNGAPDIELFYRAISAWEASGILPVFSAGNSGPRPGTITKPHEHPSVIAVGATAEDGKITSFSSRGPANFKGKEIQKPDLTAPGSNIRSTIPNGYGQMSGTSMAAPHVTGSVALLLQVDARLNPTQIRNILVNSVVPMSENGQVMPRSEWNKVYGFGKLNIYQAVKMVRAVRDSRWVGELAFLELGMLKTPETLAVRDLLSDSESEQMSEAEFDYPEDLEGLTWISASDIL